MTRVAREIVVHAPPAAVFALLVDPRERAQWLTSMREEPMEGELRVGSVVRGRRTATGSRSSYASTVVKLEAPRRVEMEVRRNAERVGRGGYELTAEGDSTRVNAWGELELRGLQRMMAPVVAAGMEKELDADLQSLKRHAEAEKVPAGEST